MNVFFYTLGCKVNQYETEGMKEVFSDSGFVVKDKPEGCDVLVINSCTVTSVSDKKTRQMIHKFKKGNPGAVVALTGCFPQAFPEEAAALPEVDIITGTKHKGQLVQHCLDFLANPHRIVAVEQYRAGDRFEQMQVHSAGGRTRSFVKIQDGCDNWCSYCIIPAARGPVRSKPLGELLEEVDQLAGAGFREVVLVGINLCFYGRESGLTLTDAVEAIAHRHPGLRIRLGSLEPELISDGELARLAALPGFCPNFHLSLQSGCDATLGRMRRHYDTSLYRKLVDNIRSRFDCPSITTDLLVGFPGETQEEFETTCRFAQEIGFAKVHIFPYSVRPGTRAADMPEQVPQQVKTARAAALKKVTDPLRQAFLQGMQGRLCRVLAEQRRADGLQCGYTENYMPVAFPCGEELTGQVVSVRITGVKNGELTGELV